MHYQNCFTYNVKGLVYPRKFFIMHTVLLINSLHNDDVSFVKKNSSEFEKLYKFILYMKNAKYN